LENITAALDASDFWNQFQTEWVCLDAELMPWSAKAQELLHQQYAAVGAAAQASLTCRGREYLRIIYGPEYLLPENLERLRSRSVSSKQSLALREFALAIEALERFVWQEPLRRVHECVFGVLALESEPIDPRLSFKQLRLTAHIPIFLADSQFCPKPLPSNPLHHLQSIHINVTP
jgi:hypothetical protein